MSNKEQLQANNELLASILASLSDAPTYDEIMGVINNHIGDKENPHNVTIEQLKAAPMWTYGTEGSMTVGAALETGKIHLIYE